MGLLIGCFVVSAGNYDIPEYIPWTWFWGITTVVVGTVFAAQTWREYRD